MSSDSRLRKTRMALVILVLSGLILAMTFTANIGLIRFVSAASADGRVTDFNGDGYSDIAIGVPNELIASICCGFGAVNVIYGSELAGLSPASTIPDQVFNQNSPNVDGVAQPYTRFGHALAIGDFNSDGYDDLAVGVPDEDMTTSEGTFPNAGAVNVIYGSPDGLSRTFVSDQLWHQNSPSMDEVASETEMFGYSLTSGDYNGDGYDELAIGIPREGVNHNTIDFAGAVHVIFGTAQGLSATGIGGIGRADQLFTQNSPDVQGVAEEADFFGWSLG